MLYFIDVIIRTILEFLKAKGQTESKITTAVYDRV